MLNTWWGARSGPWPDPAPPAPLARYRTVIPRSSATHTQIFSILPCRWAGFLFLGFGPPPGLFSQNAPSGRHTHALRYPHANFQPPSMSLGWIFILGVLAPWSAPWLFSPNAPTICHSHALRYPHANFQPPRMSFGWIFIFGPLAAPLTFFTKRTHKLSFPCHQLPTCKISASKHVVRLD